MNLIKIHRNYLLNKICIIVICIVLLLSFFANILCIISINQEYNWFEGINAYHHYIDNIVLFFKLVTINLICYLWGSAFNKDVDSYHLLINGFRNIKLKYLITKLVILLMITFLIISINVLFSAFLGVLCSNWYFSHKIIVKLFVVMYLLSIIYGIVSAVFSTLINSNYVYLLSSGLFVLGEFLNESSFSFCKLYFIFFPNLYEIDYGFAFFSVFHLIILSLFYLMLIIIIYIKNVKY